MHDFFEGSLAGILGARIQPVDLARRLADHMDDHRLVGAGRTYAPNVFRVFLSPRTLLSFAAFQGDLEEALAAFLAERSRERGLHLVGRVRVSLLGDTVLRPEQLRIDSDVVDRSGDGTPSDRTQSIAVPPLP